MIFKGYKDKFIEKSINKKIKNRVVQTHHSKINTLGVIINKNEPVNYRKFVDLIETLKISVNNFKLIVYTTEKTIDTNALYDSYNTKDININGSIKNLELKQFLDKEFDALISYYTQDVAILKLLTVTSKAKFKIGILQKDERINDLIIKTELSDFVTFKTELIKYLTILKKI